MPVRISGIILHAQLCNRRGRVPTAGNGLYALELVGLLARVAENRELIASFVAPRARTRQGESAEVKLASI